MSKVESPLLRNIIAGGSAGVVELVVMYPLDVVKTRAQASSSRNRNMFSVLKRVLLEEKGGVYRGLLFPLLTEVPKRAVKFTANSGFRNALQEKGIAKGQVGATLAGCLTGCLEGAIVCAPELIKIRMQLPENKRLYSSSFQACSSILKKEGFSSLFTGLGVTVMRNGSWNSAYFGSIFFIKNKIGGEEGVGKDLLAGTLAGSLGTFLNTPLDVVKTRLQNAAARGSPCPGSSSPLPTGRSLFGSIVREEGVQALWKGFTPKVARLGPGGGIMLVVFRAVSDWLS